MSFFLSFVARVYGSTTASHTTYLSEIHHLALYLGANGCFSM